MNPDIYCHAIILHGQNAGTRCIKRTNNVRCKIHTDSLAKHGLCSIITQESTAVMERKMRKAEADYNDKRIDSFDFDDLTTEIQTEFRAKLEEAIRLSDGVDYIAEWKYRKSMNRWNRLHRDAVGGNVNPNENIRAFSEDNQNVHTQIIVNQTTDIINMIRKTDVPEEYRWNNTKCSKTPADIITHCHLTPDATFQMMSKYCSNETIYDLEEGIYGKTLDSVWQFTLKSADKEALIKILKTELEDNIGMCAQGNLSRLCNIVAGYMEGVQLQESPREILGREFPRIREIEDVNARTREAERVLEETSLPRDQWAAWLDAL
jgi:hypothetical protein